MRVTCDYCGVDAKLVTGDVIYPHRLDLRAKRFWHCAPCDAYVGTHENSPQAAPLGRLANSELRALKQQVHAAFDPLWRGHGTSRTECYRWLARAMGIPSRECHIGMFNPQRCRDAIAVLAAGLRPSTTGVADG